jgi:putative tryptophan/tyrosine transport system substrate-binding protein
LATCGARAAANAGNSYLGSESSQLFASRLDAFRQGLRETGYEEGRNVMIEYRWAEGHNDRLPQLAADLVRRQVDVIATPGSFVAGLAAKAATTSIPIVFETGADPIAVGLVTSMNRPDGNVTGITSLNAEVEPKRLELLHSLAPAVSTFALLVNPTNPKNAETTAGKLSAAAEAVGVKFHIVKAASEDALEAVFAQIAALGAGGLVVGNDIFFTSHATQMADLTVRHGMPAVQSSGIRTIRWADELRWQLHAVSQPGWHVHRPHPEREQAWRLARPAGHERRARHQHEDGQGAQPDSATRHTSPRRRGD